MSDNTSEYKSLQDKIVKDLNINFQIVFTFGMGVTCFYPIIDNLIKNTQLDITITKEMVVMLGICAIAILCKESKPEIKKLLEELRLRGIYDLLKKVVNSLRGIYILFGNVLIKSLKVLNSIIDMFAYTALMVPFLVAIGDITQNGKFNLNNFPGELLSIATGTITFAIKNFITLLIDKLKNKIDINKEEILGKFKVERNKSIQKYSEFEPSEHMITDDKNNK